MSPRRREGPAWNSQTKTFYFDECVGFKPNRRRIRIALGTADEAEANRRWRWRREYEWKRSLGLAPPAAAPPKTLTLAGLTKEYVAYLKDLKRVQEWKISESRLRIVREVLGDLALDAIGHAEFSKLDAALRAMDPPRSEATINHYVKVVRSLYNYAIRKKIYRGDNPTSDVKPYLTESKRRAYSPEEMKKILNAAAEIAAGAGPGADMMAQAYRITLLLYLTGARIGELLNLKWESIDKGAIVLRRSETKQRKVKVIPVTAQIGAILEELRAMKRDDFVLPFRRRGGGHLPSRWVNQVLHRIREKSGVKDFLFHGLRHTAATILSTSALGHGASLADIMLLLGHSKSETTLRYTHANIDRMRKALEIIPQVGYNPARSNAEAKPKREAEPSRVGQSARVKKRK